jgi:anti-sigma factor RsiW
MSLFDRFRRKGRSPKAARALACQELVELITDYLEDSLSTEDRTRFEAHLATCGGCSAYLDQMRQTISVVGRLREDDIPPPAMDELLVTFRAWKRSHAAGT